MNLAKLASVDFNPRLPWWGGDLQTIRNYALNVSHALPGQAAERVLVPLATVSAPLDLARSCRSLLRWRNYGYHRYIVTHLKRGCTAPGAALTEAERKAILGARSLWQFDHDFTAPRNGYAGAEAFYEANSSGRFLHGIRADTLLIHAQDDPFVPVAPYLAYPWSRQPALVPLLPESGGHLGFHDPLGLWHLRQIGSFFDARA